MSHLNRIIADDSIGVELKLRSRSAREQASPKVVKAVGLQKLHARFFPTAS